MDYTHMFPDEYDAYMEKAASTGGPIAVIPIGCVEQHGPHLLLGCDGYIALALAHMTSEKCGGALCPMVPFSWIGGLRLYAGTIDMRSTTTGDYLEQLLLELFSQGFARIILVNCHGGGRELVFSVSRKVYKQVKKPILALFPGEMEMKAPEMGKLWLGFDMEPTGDNIESAELCGALRYLGQEELCLQVLQNGIDTEAEVKGCIPKEVPGLQSVFQMSEVGHDYLHEFQHVAPSSGIVPEAGIKMLDYIAEKMAQAILAV